MQMLRQKTELPQDKPDHWLTLQIPLRHQIDVCATSLLMGVEAGWLTEIAARTFLTSELGQILLPAMAFVFGCDWASQKLSQHYLRQNQVRIAEMRPPQW